jgi:hypothetical protein
MISLQDFITSTIVQIQKGVDNSNKSFKEFYAHSISLDIYIDENAHVGGNNKITLDLSINHPKE